MTYSAILLTVEDAGLPYPFSSPRATRLLEYALVSPLRAYIACTRLFAQISLIDQEKKN